MASGMNQQYDVTTAQSGVVFYRSTAVSVAI